MSTIQSSTFTFTSPDGPKIFVRKWAPTDGTPAKAVVQIAHGAAEHSLRYARLAEYLAGNGYVVYANDHRGHYMTAGSLENAGKAGPDGWNGMVRDVKQLTDLVKKENPGLPVFLFGHSMGSFLAQQYIQNWGEGLTGVVLSGTTGTLGDIDGPIALLEGAVQSGAGDQPSELFGAMFAAFNQPFAPAKTGFEWLSRDEAEVQKYADDPWCGFPFTNRLVLDMFRGGKATWTDANEARIPKHLPVYIFSGELDPVGGNTLAVKELIRRYQAQGIQNVAYRFYPGDRHETLNETNRDEVQADLLDWLDRTLAGEILSGAL